MKLIKLFKDDPSPAPPVEVVINYRHVATASTDPKTGATRLLLSCGRDLLVEGSLEYHSDRMRGRPWLVWVGFLRLLGLRRASL